MKSLADLHKTGINCWRYKEGKGTQGGKLETFLLQDIFRVGEDSQDKNQNGEKGGNKD